MRGLLVPNEVFPSSPQATNQPQETKNLIQSECLELHEKFAKECQDLVAKKQSQAHSAQWRGERAGAVARQRRESDQLFWKHSFWMIAEKKTFAVAAPRVGVAAEAVEL